MSYAVYTEYYPQAFLFGSIAVISYAVLIVLIITLIISKKEKRRQMKKTKIVAGISAFLVPTMIIAATFYKPLVIAETFINIPDIVGMDYELCKEEYDYINLSIIEEQYSSEYPEGTIIRQSPQSYKGIRGGIVESTDITCVVSKGPRMIMVSNVIGLDFEDANEILGEKNDHFRVGFVSEYSDDVPKGKVIATDPPAGEKVAYGSAVKVTVSGGKEPDVTDDETAP